MRTHVAILGWLQILLGVLDLLLALLLFGVITGLGALTALGGDLAGVVAGGFVGTLVGGVLALTALPNLLAGWGLLQHRGWGRLLALVLAILNGLKFPWGTAFAVYTIWVLTRPETERLFRS